MPAIITRERPDTSDAISLINELEAHLEARYPSESRHGLSVERLLAEDVAFFLLRTHGTPKLWRHQIGGQRVWRDQADVCASTISGLRVREVDAHPIGSLCPGSPRHLAAPGDGDSAARGDRALRAVGLLPYPPVRSLHRRPPQP